MTTTQLPAAVAAADARAEAADHDRSVVARALRLLTRARLGYEEADRAADIAATIVCPDGTPRSDAVWWEMFDRFDKGPRSELRLVLACVLMGDAATARDKVLRWCEDMACDQLQEEAERIRVDGAGRLYEVL